MFKVNLVANNFFFLLQLKIFNDLGFLLDPIMHLSDYATILTLNSCPILIPVPGKYKVGFFLNTHYIVNEKHIYSILRALAAMKPSFGRF